VEQTPLVGVERTENALAQPVDAAGVGALPVPMGLVRVERRGASVDGDERAAADRIVHRAQCAEAQLLDLAGGLVVGAAAGPLDEDAL
jgi:hypothetical protein